MAFGLWKRASHAAVPLHKPLPPAPMPTVLTTSYDTRCHEVESIIHLPTFTGLKCEVAQMLAPWLQVSAISTRRAPATSIMEAITNQHGKTTTQLFTTLLLPRSVFQFSFDTDKSYQLKSSAQLGPLTGRLHTIVSGNKEVFAQAEAIYNTVISTASLKLIRHALQASDFIYVMSYWRSFGQVCCGVEAVGAENRVGISLATRIENAKGVVTASWQRFNAVSGSVYRRLTRWLEVGVEARTGAGAAVAAGCRLRTPRTEMKCTVDHAGRVGFLWDERLSTALSVCFSGLCDSDGLSYGLSLCHDPCVYGDSAGRST